MPQIHQRAIADRQEKCEVIASCAEVSAKRLGKRYRRTDKPEQPQEHLATPTTMDLDMGMTYWLEKAEAEMSELKT